MDTELIVLTKEEIEKNPEVVGQNLAILAKAIEESKADITAIKNRSLWARLWSNNTRDLADTMLKQNEIISAYITVVQGIIWLTMNNIALLALVMDAMEKAEQANALIENRYSKMAKDFMTESIKAAEKTINNEKEIKELKDEVARLYSIKVTSNSKTIAYIALLISSASLALTIKYFT